MFSLDLDFVKSLNLMAALCKLGQIDKAMAQLQFHLNSRVAVAMEVGTPLSPDEEFEVMLDIEDALRNRGVLGLVLKHYDSAVPVTSISNEVTASQ